MRFNPKDHYFKKAKKEKFKARSAFKLSEIDEKFSILKAGIRVVDFGYYPGSWLQYLMKQLGQEMTYFGFDIQSLAEDLHNPPSVNLFQISILEHERVKDKVGDPVDLILSDMAPKTTGIKHVDQENSYQLNLAIVELVPFLLGQKGNLIFKFFEGPDNAQLTKELRKHFKTSKILRPKATRSSSKEAFFIGMCYLQSK